MEHKKDQTLDDAVGEGVSIDTLAALETICVKTQNTFYRIFLVDPQTGQALIEGGQFAEPVDAFVYGSVASGSTPKFGWIGVGMRLQFWTNDRRVSTSPVESFYIESHAMESVGVR